MLPSRRFSGAPQLRLDRLLPALTGLIARTAHEKKRKRLEERATANRLRPDWSESDQSGLPPGPAA